MKTEKTLLPFEKACQQAAFYSKDSTLYVYQFGVDDFRVLIGKINSPRAVLFATYTEGERVQSILPADHFSRVE